MRSLAAEQATAAERTLPQAFGARQLATHGVILVRDSKTPDHGPLTFTRQEWEAFTAGVHDGEFDL